ncbi:hypothetical protein CHCC14819_0431 [Bacillus licheniformis]|nr:hypothetical protein [Bacillus licheniformis]TWM32235.1 hypothetical protein CHCC14819_0431 [Bacillus licheniformis]
MTREMKINFIIDSMWHLEGVVVEAASFEDYTDEEIDNEVEWYEYLWTK